MVTIQTLALVKDATTHADAPQTGTVKFRVGGNTHIYNFFVDSSNDLVFNKSTDGGATFGLDVTINSTDNWQTVTAWFDKWTPSDTGDIIHLAATEITTDNLRYFSIDTASADAVGGNVLIVDFTDLFSATVGCPTITKATNGDLFAAAIGLTPAGIKVGKSTDSGVSFSDVTGGGAADFNEDQDTIQLMPLSTDDDVILIGTRETEADLRSVVYDNSVTDAFEGSSVLIDTASSIAGLSHSFGLTLDKSSSTIYLVYSDGGVSTSESDALFTSYPDSTRVWATAVPIIHTFETATTQVLDGDKVGFSLARDQTDGIMLLAIAVGRSTTSKFIILFISSNDGATWSDPIKIPTVVPDDYRKTQQSMAVLDQAEGWYISWFNDDTNLLDGLLATIPTEFFTGINYDADGKTEVAGSTITVQEVESRFAAGGDFGGKQAIMSASDSTISGYKVAIIPPFPDESVTTEYIGASYEDNGGANDEMDLSREATED